MDDLLQAAFRRQFADLTGNASPFVWQEDLFASFFRGSLPARIDLPTGAGKTSVMAVWLLALAAQAKQAGAGLPRRLVWVVDRRVVEEADRLAKRLDKEQSLAGVREALAELCYGIAPGDSPLAVSTLRGEREDNREWSENPTRPAIVVGTVDMVGSRLLFSGYGDGRSSQAAKKMPSVSRPPSTTCTHSVEAFRRRACGRIRLPQMLSQGLRILRPCFHGSSTSGP
jgi:CRISPR-associated endonuclease/helicase Cas3